MSTPETPRKRSRFFVNQPVQRALAARAISHWGFALLIFAASLFFGQVVGDPSRGLGVHLQATWSLISPAVILSLVFIPIVVMDNLRLSNRFAGPVVRLRNELRRLNEGQQIRPIRFRDKDFFSELAIEVNQLAARLDQLQEVPANDADQLPVGSSNAERQPVGV